MNSTASSTSAIRRRITMPGQLRLPADLQKPNTLRSRSSRTTSSYLPAVAKRQLFILARLSSLRPSDDTKGQVARRLQRLGIRRLARRLLSAGHAEVRLPEALLERLRPSPSRFLALSEPGPHAAHGMAQVIAPATSVPGERS